MPFYLKMSHNINSTTRLKFCYVLTFYKSSMVHIRFVKCQNVTKFQISRRTAPLKLWIQRKAELS